ncbi:MAG: cytidylate kinase family protein [Desulfocapsaceae bacterium]
MAIITISRQIGSLGDEIAKATADTLGYQYIEKVQISEILSKCGFSISDIDKLDEKKPSVWQTLSMQTEIFSHFIRAAVNELAARKNVVIVGRGAQVILQDIPGVLSVRVIAPFKTRVSRLMEQRGYDEKDAHRIVRQTDRDSSGYLSNYFEANLNDNGLYDLVINTRAMTLKESVEMITCAVGADKIKESPQMSEALYDLSLNHRAKAALLEVTDKVEWVDLELNKGIALLSGLVSSAAMKNECEKVILNIPGINSVENQLNVRDEKTTIY